MMQIDVTSMLSVKIRPEVTTVRVSQVTMEKTVETVS